MLKQLIRWITFVAAAATISSTTLAQHYQPFSTVEETWDGQPFEPFDASDYGDPWPGRVGWFFGYERFVSWINRPEAIDIGEPRLEVPVVSGSGYRQQYNTHNTSMLTADDAYGNRYEVGYMDGDVGWMVGIVDGQPQDQLIDLINMDVVFRDDPVINVGGRSVGFLHGFVNRSPGDGVDDNLGEEVGGGGVGDAGVSGRFEDGDLDGVINPLDPDDQIDDPANFDYFDMFRLPVLFSQAQVRNLAYLDGVEVMRNHVMWQLHNRGMFEFGYGVRFFRFRDRFRVRGFGGILDASEWHMLADNNVVGPQLMARWYRRDGRWTISGETRFLAGFNFQDLRLTGFLGSSILPVTRVPDGADGRPPLNNPPLINTTDRAANTPAFMDPVSFSHGFIDEVFSPTGELRLKVAYAVSSQIELQAGYTGQYTWGVARASNNIVYRMPDMGIRTDNNEENLWVNMVTFGFQWNR